MSRIESKLKLFIIPFLTVISACNGSSSSTDSASNSDSAKYVNATETSGSGVNTTESGTSNGSSPTTGNIPSNSSTPAPSSTTPSPTPTPTSTPAAPTARAYSTDVLLFVGDGTWSAEVSSLKNIFQTYDATYQTATSAQMNAMSLDDFSKFGVIVFPGGSGGTQAGSLTSKTKSLLRAAVQERGVGYAGFCAGAFVAQAPAPAPGKDVSYGIGIVDGPVLDYYYLEYQGISTAMTKHAFADGSTADILWYGGPVTTNVPGGVVAKYPDGNPAISEMWSGKGFVVIAGGHPTSTQSMLSSLGVSSSDGVHLDVAWNMIHAAMTQQPLPAFSK